MVGALGKKVGHVGHLPGGRFYGSSTVGERGQVVIPVEARKELGLEIGDKVMVFGSHHGNGLIMLKADLVTEYLQDLLRAVGLRLEDADRDEERAGRRPGGEQPTGSRGEPVGGEGA